MTFKFTVESYLGPSEVEYDFDLATIEWLETEKKFWKALEGYFDPDSAAKKYISQIAGRIQYAVGQVTHIIDYEVEPNTPHTYRNSAIRKVNEMSLPFLSGDPAAEFIEMVSQNEPEVGYLCLKILAGAHSAMSEEVNPIDRIKSQRLVSDFLRSEWSPNAHVASKSADASMKTLLGRVRRKLKDIEKREDEVFKNIKLSSDKKEIESNKFKKVLRRRVARNIVTNRRSQIGLVEQTDDSIKSINDTKEAFTQYMNLAAPVEYWSKKAKSHLAKEDTYMWLLIFYAGIILTGFFGLLILVYLNSESVTVHLETRAGLTLTGLFLTVTTILFWIGRILTRIFLSEKHLRTDAEEREVMITTYLALIKDGQATDAERAIVLAPIFRPTEDGLVKDDAAPLADFSKILRSGN